MNEWLNKVFLSSSTTTPQFTKFANDFKKYIISNLPENAELVSFNKGHFYVSGFIKRGDKFVYFSINDVRFNKNEWNNRILIRTAKNDKDYSGGYNMFTTLDNFKGLSESLLNR